MKQQVLSVASKLGRTAQQHNWKMSQNITDQMMIAIRKFLKGVTPHQMYELTKTSTRCLL